MQPATPTGLSQHEADLRLAQHGPNQLDEAPPRPWPLVLLAQFTDVMILILLAAAIVSGVIGDLADTLVIIAVVLLNAVLGFTQEFRAERAVQALRAMGAPTATVVRDGSPRVVRATELVPGDLVHIEAGAIVPADMRLVEAAQLRVDESALTGESVPVDKHIASLAHDDAAGEAGGDTAVGDRRHMAHKGTIVTYGRGTGVVTATGMHTEFGRIAQLLTSGTAVQTPLQRRLAVFGRWLALVVVAICVVVFVTGLLRGEPPLQMLLVALSLAVAAIPEALVAVVSISLALGARRMATHNALIRRLAAVETLGSVTFICSDKTGTLTANRMVVERYWCDGAQAAAPGDSAAWRTLLQAMAVSHDALPGPDGVPVGDPTEVALAVAADAAGFHRAEQVAQAPRVAELPFDSARKCMTTVHQGADGSVLSITKGAAEVVIRASTRALHGEGVVPVDQAALLQAADAMAAAGLRVLGVAVRRWPQLPAGIGPELLERELDFVGLIGLIDPPRPEAAAAVATCRAAGIVPVMITGDHPLTARAVARRLGFLGDDDDAALVTGAELGAMSDAAFARRVHDVRVFARVAPEQKVRIVTALQDAGHVVAMTGDGVNDAPALRRSDIGVAMGIQGTDVAKEAGAMVLLDDNFATIVRAIHEGRRIYDNLRRFVRYVLTTNSAEIWTIFLAPFLGLPVPLLPIQILWINLVTDGLPGLALAAEPAEGDVMRRPPRPPGQSLFAQGLGAHALLVGLAMAGLTLSVQAWYVSAGSDAWQTMVFTTLCFAQLGHVLAIRHERASIFGAGFRGNPALTGAVAFTLLLQLALIYLPGLNALFGTVPLAPVELGVCLGVALLILLLVEAEKWIRRRRAAS